MISLLAYLKATDFCKLTLSPDLLKVFISCRRFLKEFVGSFMYTICK